jgi:MOSC domain-containing protein YiiM
VEAFEGSVVAVFLTAEGGGEPVETPEVSAVAGRGLEGDRYFAGTGTFMKEGDPPDPRQEITLIESEAIEAAAGDEHVELELGASRRNVVTRGVPLNHLVGREFAVGEVRLRGLKLCEPCAYLESKAMPGVRRAFAHRGGLRAQILQSGTLRKGDPVRPA